MFIIILNKHVVKKTITLLISAQIVCIIIKFSLIYLVFKNKKERKFIETY